MGAIQRICEVPEDFRGNAPAVLSPAVGTFEPIAVEGHPAAYCRSEPLAGVDAELTLDAAAEIVASHRCPEEGIDAAVGTDKPVAFPSGRLDDIIIIRD